MQFASSRIPSPSHRASERPDAEASLILVHDGNGLERTVAPMLRQNYATSLIDLQRDAITFSDRALAVVVCIDLGNPASIKAIRDHFVDHPVQVPRIFVLPNGDRRSILQAYSSGAHQFMVSPVTPREIHEVLTPITNRSVEWQWRRLSETQQAALRISLKLFEDSQTSVLRGEGLEVSTAARACSSVISAVGHEGFPALLNELRAHHNYTFRHSMYVTGSLVAFANVLNFREEDMSLAAMAGLLHDIGKIATPNAILNKPSRLEPSEWLIMRQHPLDGLSILKRNGDWPEPVLDAVSHHHEKLDGSGYFDGLSGDSIKDLTRMVSIADTFSALIDKRAYKPPMSGKEAMAIMLGAEGHLDMALVRAFEPVALAIG